MREAEEALAAEGASRRFGVETTWESLSSSAAELRHELWRVEANRLALLARRQPAAAQSEYRQTSRHNE